MPFSSGQFTLYAPGNPVTTGETISSDWANNTLTDIATGLSTCVLKDGTQTMTAALPMGGFRITGLGAATARTDAIRLSQVQDSTALYIGNIAGTNTVTGTLTPSITAYVTGQQFLLTPANTNTGATTLNLNGVGAGAIQSRGQALVGGELIQSIPSILVCVTATPVFELIGTAPFDDLRPLVVGSSDPTKKIRFEVDGLTAGQTRVLTAPNQDSGIGLVLGTEQATTSGTSIDFTGIPAWVKRITVSLIGVSTNGSADLTLQIGAGSVANTGYLSRSVAITDAGNDVKTFTIAFGLSPSVSASSTFHGTVTLTLEDSSDGTWSMAGILSYSDTDAMTCSAGSKTLSGTLDRVRLTTGNGTDTFDAGAINILME